MAPGVATAAAAAPGSSSSTSTLPPMVPGPSLIAIHEGITDVREALGRVHVANGDAVGSEREWQQRQEAAWAELRSVG